MSMDNRASEITIPEALTKISQSVQSKIESGNVPSNGSEHEYKPELPIHRKEVVEANRQKNSELKDSIIESTTAIGQSLTSDETRLSNLQYRANPTTDDLKEIGRLNTNIERTSKSLNNIKTKSESMYQLTKEVLIDQTKDAMENYVDDKTGLYLMSVVTENSHQRIDNWINNKGLGPRGYKIVMTDMMLFHTANQRLGTTGLDDRLFTCMQGQIAASKYLGGEKNLYSQMSPDEIENNKYVQKYFPAGSETRLKIDELKAAGVEISPFRVNAGGGDEFGYTVEFTKEINPANETKYEQLSSDIISHIVESTSLSKDFDVIDESVKTRELTPDELIDRNEQYKYFYNSINHLKFTSRPERGIVLTPKQIETNSFLDSLRSYFMDQQTQGLGQEILDPKINVSMEHATINFNGNLPTLEDGLMLTIYGKDSYLETHKHNKYGLFDESGNFNETKIDNYTTDLAIHLKNVLSSEDIKNPEIVKKTLQDIIISDSVKNTFHILNEEVNVQGKHNKKTDVFLSAIAGDAKSIITVGASEQSDRALYTPQTEEERTDITQRIKDFYKKMIDQNDQDPYLLKLKQDLEGKNINL